MNIDCGSYTPAGVDEVGGWSPAFLRRARRDASRPGRTRRAGSGDTVVGDVRGRGRGGPRVLLIGHMDTVFDPGTAAERPFRDRPTAIATGPA